MPHVDDLLLQRGIRTPEDVAIISRESEPWLEAVIPEPALYERSNRAFVTQALGLITGITTAYLLKKAGKTVAVVDLQDVGGGETGHTTAHVTFVTDTRLSELVSRVGKKQAQALWDAGLTFENLHGLGGCKHLRAVFL